MKINTAANYNYNKNSLNKANKNQSFGHLYVSKETYKTVRNILGNDKEAYHAFVKKVKELSQIPLNLNEIMRSSEIYHWLTKSFFGDTPYCEPEVRKSCGDELLSQFIDCIGEEQANEYTFEYQPLGSLGFKYFGKGVDNKYSWNNHGKKADDSDTRTEITPDIINDKTELIATGIGMFNPQQYAMYDKFGSKDGHQVCLPKDLKNEVGMVVYSNLSKILRNKLMLAPKEASKIENAD